MNRFFVLTVLLVFTGLNGFFITQSIAAFGDCNDALNEANASCTGVVDCSDGQCFLINTSCTGGYTCNPDPCTAAKSDKIKKFGACENTYWDYGCFHCSFYYCAEVIKYQSEDSFGECQFARCRGLLGQSNACVPSSP
ncbi:hypothetical protein MalM14_40040 [Gimesia chilikensis]|jgi:hypothetical protein|nr:hypothetical protein MalM14_40040 [Gimesia chilikensis]